METLENEGNKFPFNFYLYLFIFFVSQQNEQTKKFSLITKTKTYQFLWKCDYTQKNLKFTSCNDKKSSGNLVLKMGATIVISNFSRNFQVVVVKHSSSVESFSPLRFYSTNRCSRRKMPLIKQEQDSFESSIPYFFKYLKLKIELHVIFSSSVNLEIYAVK